MKRVSVFRIGVFSLALATAGLAQAASPVAGDYEESYSAQGNDLSRLERLSDDERLARLERLQDSGVKYQGQLLQQIQQLQQQLAELQGTLEETQYKLRQLEQRGGVAGAAPAGTQTYSTQNGYTVAPPQDAMPVDPSQSAVQSAPQTAPGAAIDPNQPLPDTQGTASADTGMGPGFGGAISTGAPSPAGAAPAQVQLPASAQAAPALVQPPSANELADLDKAFQMVRSKQYDAAAAAYKQFIGNYPNSESTPTAHYWLGQVYFAKRDYDASQKEFQTVLERYPGHAKTDEAMLKLAYIHQSKGNNPKAISVYNEILKRFPGKPSAQLAGKRLEALKKSG
ncbi:MAG: tol-pal system protein YbgF [Gammaproteobacteria bacterium]|nr:tol-pal system protein YbgF [Gammaproteobacteria bacterium]